MDAFNKGLALRDPPAAPLRIPFERTSLPAYFIPAVGYEAAVRPLLICTNGYDATITDMFFASAVAATARGYHCLIFDGPGQGEMLIEHGVTLRPDWETVIKAVVDFALTLSLVDPARIALSGWSLGGYLAPRAASGEHRLAACIADPGLWSMTSGLRAFCEKLGVPAEAAANPADIEQSLLDKMWQAISGDRKLRWTIIQRGFWVNGAEDLREFLRCITSFTLDGRAELIRCPTLITHAEDDPLATSALDLFDALRCPKALVRFSSAEGAGTHCEMMNRSAVNRRVADWLDDVFGN
jgi:alpha-beta hydrolase superfamily lysophospholipase